MVKDNNLLEKVNSILFNDWDPIDISDSAPVDEYKIYAEAIINMSPDNIYPTYIAKYLETIASKNIGCSLDFNIHLNVAKKIVFLFGN